MPTSESYGFGSNPYVSSSHIYPAEATSSGAAAQIRSQSIRYGDSSSSPMYASNPLAENAHHFRNSKKMIEKLKENRVPHRFIRIVHEPQLPPSGLADNSLKSLVSQHQKL